MKDNIVTIQEQLRDGTLSARNPHGCAEAKALLSGEYSFWAGMLEEIVVYKATEWPRLRLNHKSDKQCDIEWSGTPQGKNEAGIEIKLKRIQNMQSALSSLLRMAEMEMKNI